VAAPNIIQRPGSESATGFARESSPNVPVAANAFLPMADNTLEPDPGWFSPNLMQGVRDKQIYNLYGEAKYQGTVTGPLFPSNAMEALVCSIGADAIVGWGVAALPATPTSTTSSASTVTGATSVTVTSATGFAAGQQIVVDTGVAQEFRKIASIAGSVITLSDALQYPHASGVAVATGTTTTLSASSAANATTVTVTSASGMSANTTMVQIDVNSPSGTTTSEIRKVTGIATNTLTLDVALVYAHGSGVQVTIVSAPYTHVISQQNSLPTLTVEKNIGGFQSQQFAGCMVNKWELKAPVGNTAPEIAVDMMAQSVAVLDTPTGISVTPELPFVFAEANLTMYGTARADAANITATIENIVKDTYTYANMHGPAFLTPVQVHGSGSVDVVWSSLDNATYGDYLKMQNGTLGALQFALAHPAAAGSVALYYPQVALSKQTIPLKVDDVVMDTLTWEASRPLTGPSQYTVQATVVNSVYVAY
jgi:hypothetical protein